MRLGGFGRSISLGSVKPGRGTRTVASAVRRAVITHAAGSGVRPGGWQQHASANAPQIAADQIDGHASSTEQLGPHTRVQLEQGFSSDQRSQLPASGHPWPQQAMLSGAAFGGRADVAAGGGAATPRCGGHRC